MSFDEVLLTGLAPDGGLFVPAAWPRLSATDQHDLSGRSYAEIATEIIGRFVDEGPLTERLPALIDQTYRIFDHQAVAPLVQVGPNLWLMELFHGPTLAFKDVALQLLGRLFDAELTAQGRRMTIIGATSGDTGSAAIEACRDSASLDIFILYPKGRPSEVQRRQMTTVDSPNVHAIAIDGDFDDCQKLVKAMFADQGMARQLGLSAVNSINWARIAGQMVYYVTAALALGAPERAIAFTVPTGNFGNVYAAFAARRMGLPIARLGVASNRNDILTRFLESGTMQRETVSPTLSPSMDIQVSSNFERFLFELFDRDGEETAAAMEHFAQEGSFGVTGESLETTRAIFTGGRVDDDETLDEIARTHGETGMLIDPHTAVGLRVARRLATSGEIDPTTPQVALACAHAAKFPEAVKRATGRHPELPERLGDLLDRPERHVTLAADLNAVKAFIRARARGRPARQRMREGQA